MQKCGTIKYADEMLTTERQAKLRGKEIVLIPQSVNYLTSINARRQQVRTSVKDGNPIKAQREVFGASPSK